jgi:hypothetical protein
MPVTSTSNVLPKHHHETTLPLIDLRFDVLQIPLGHPLSQRDHVITSRTIHPTAPPWCRLLRAPILEIGIAYRRNELWVEDSRGDWSTVGLFGMIIKFKRYRPISPTDDNQNIP